jgi:GAF domain-containing protein
MSAFLHEARRLNGATAGFVGRWDEERQVITGLVDSLAHDGHVPRTLALGEGAAGKAAASRAPVILNNYQQVHHAQDDALLTGAHAALAAPLLHDGRLLGVVVCVSDDPLKQFTNDDAEMLVMLGSVAASDAGRARATAHRPARPPAHGSPRPVHRINQ